MELQTRSCRINDAMRRTRPQGRCWVAALLALLLCLPLVPAVSADDAGFSVLYARSRAVAHVVRLDAGFKLQLSRKLGEAIERGVPVVIAIEIEVARSRDYLWNETITEVQQRHEISYNALTGKYVLRNLNSGVQYTLPSLSAVMAVIGTVADFPLLDQSLLQDGELYIGRIRALVDVESLPVPLRMRAYLSSSWGMESEWYEWSLQP